ncbi:alanine racemase [Celerinatantimonas sp. YJH-8]|uniref:alanine racemase n=1 Tax=Celerinatantimonas sp. YJH-8 TaxID=3228714 RepID=UPI0038CB528E
MRDQPLPPQLAKIYQRLTTPYLLIDKSILARNLHRLRHKIEAAGCRLRPHFKTLKSLSAAPYLLPRLDAPITVSTLAEAEALAGQGYTNMIYAVGIVGEKLLRVQQLLQQGVTLHVLLDSPEQAAMVNQFCDIQHCQISALIEIDCDGHRAGLSLDDPRLLQIARSLHHGNAVLAGILIHAGESYHCRDPQALHQAAAHEVAVANQAKQFLLVHQLPCDIVSIGSTPTACSYSDLTGISEVRAGVYSLFDLVMTQVGVCTLEDIAARVVTTIIGHHKNKGCLWIDAGWMALSADSEPNPWRNGELYGRVISPDGSLSENLWVTGANQEHGMITALDGAPIRFEDYPIGCRLQILPHHACATTAMHSHYYLFDRPTDHHEIWSRIQGW